MMMQCDFCFPVENPIPVLPSDPRMTLLRSGHTSALLINWLSDGHSNPSVRCPLAQTWIIYLSCHTGAGTTRVNPTLTSSSALLLHDCT